MVASITERLAKCRHLLKPSTLRWLVARFDFLIDDHIVPWSELDRASDSTIHPSVSFRSGRNIHIGRHTRIQIGCVLWASPRSEIWIGDFTGLGPGTCVFSSNHKFSTDQPYYKQPWTEKTVRIGRDVWVGAGSIVLPGVSIGEGSVVAAGSVVTKDLEPGVIAAGVPAKPIGQRIDESIPAQAIEQKLQLDSSATDRHEPIS